VKDHQVIDLEEYKQLRAEILVRLSLHNQLTSYTVAAMAAALTIFPAVPDVLLAISFLASWFWVLYASHDVFIFRAAHYIAAVLAPRLATDGQAVLGWESHLRKPDALGRQARKTGVSRSMAILFGGGTPVLVSIFWISQWPPRTLGLPLYGRVFATACVIIMWVNAIQHARFAARLRKNVSAAISN
jgi:hypothetical protein